MNKARYLQYAFFSMVLLGTVQQTLEGSGRKRYTIPCRKPLKKQSLPPKRRYKLQRRIKGQRERIEKERRKVDLEEQHNKEVFLEELYNKLVDSEEQRKKQYQEQQLLEQQRFMQQGDWQKQLRLADEQLAKRLSDPEHQKALNKIKNKQKKIRKGEYTPEGEYITDS